MKSKVILFLIVSSIIVSFGASKVAKEPIQKPKTEQASAGKQTTPIGGFVQDDH